MDLISYNRKFKRRTQELRKAGILSEALLWNEVKQKKIQGLQFFRQRPINNYIVDFYCPALKLAIEVDGSSHDDKIREDMFRQKELEALGVSFLRFADIEVRKNMPRVMSAIEAWIRKREECN